MVILHDAFLFPSCVAAVMVNEEQRKLTAILTPETTAQPLTNATVIWTSSNSKVATVDPVSADMDGSPQNSFSSSEGYSRCACPDIVYICGFQDFKAGVFFRQFFFGSLVRGVCIHMNMEGKRHRDGYERKKTGGKNRLHPGHRILL